MAKSEEARMIQNELDDSTALYAYTRIPYALLNAEVEGGTQELLEELTEICRYYKVYKQGADFLLEGSNGDYVPASLKYQMAATLINKEARFLFAEAPDIVVEPKGDVGKVSQEARDALTVMNDLVKTILDENRFEQCLLRAARDCFIGKRVAAVVNFNEEDGATLTFLPSTQFVYETKLGNPNVLTKFVCYIVVKDSRNSPNKRIFKKKYTLEDGVVYLEEGMYDGAGRLIEPYAEHEAILLDKIPAVVFVNDGLTGEDLGESEIALLKDYEQYYSRLANADIDAERKSMNPTKYVVDMNGNSTKNLSTAAGAFWDLGSEQNNEKSQPQVGMLEPHMSYSTALKTSLDRIKTAGYEQIDVPNITLESLQGAITSGKALKAIYWPLIVRCKEKMKMWGPQLSAMTDIIIQGAMAYPACVERYLNGAVVSPVAYEIKVEQNVPLPEDEAEEREMDLAEVAAQTMSRKAYMKKWRSLTDDEAAEELEQIALERQLLEDSAFSSGQDQPPYSNGTEEYEETELQ